MTTIRRHPRISASQSGSAVLAALAVLTITVVVVGTALTTARYGFRNSHHSSRWTQAVHAAEAGAEIGLLAAQKNSWVADGWSGAPGAPGTAAVTKTVTLSAGVPATGPVSTTIAADKITMGTAAWLRIRATGHADVFGGSVASLDTRDSMLRKLSLRRDRKTGATLATARATRTVEILAKPKSGLSHALLLEKDISMSGGWIDSFDSSDPTKSTNGLYDIAKRQSNGDVGINDTMGKSKLGGSYLYGDLAYSGPAVEDTQNVQGTISTPFNKPVVPVVAPTWTTFNATPTSIKTTMALTGGPISSPARYKVDDIAISGGKWLNLAPHTAGAESYVEIWVTKKLTVSGTGYIDIAPGVHATFHVVEGVDISGSAFNNRSNRAENNVINVVTPAPGQSKNVTVSGGGNFIGVLNAPGTDLTISGDGNLSGAFIVKSATMSGSASIHFDEALRNVSGGSGSGYTVASWVEAVR